MHALNWKRLKQNFATYFAWLLFSGTIFVLMGLFKSLDRIQGYEFYWLDVIATYGITLLFAALEIAAVALVLAALQSVLEKLARQDLSKLFKSLLLALFLIVWIILLQSIKTG